MRNPLVLLLRTVAPVAGLVAGLVAGPTLADPPAHPALAAWAAAWAGNDPAGMARLYAPGAAAWTAQSRVQAVDGPTLGYALAREAESATPRALTFARHAWREYGRIAVASGLALAHPPGANDAVVPVALRFTLVWIATDGGWRILDQHLSMLPFDDE